MSKTLRLEVVTPDRLEFSGDVESVIAPTVSGYIGILPGHIPLIARLAVGVLTARTGDSRLMLAVSEGYMEVSPTKVIILAEAAEMPGEIDVQRALEAKRQAEEILATSKEHVVLTRARASLQKALNRLKVAKYQNGGGQGSASTPEKIGE
ncbi:MAG TPA: F0F1 ATP synthase subunit epsilon [Firmicutes bacterium]|nr:F0F1 ATP synthase subunit epsilon [Bacillota bacterium]